MLRILAAGALAGLASTAFAAATPTFDHDVAPIVYRNCMACHRSGEVGPFPLTNYAQVKRKARNILKVIDGGVMPPWPARSHGEFLNERVLTAAQKQTLHDWIQAGEPEGDAADLPPAPQFTEGWQLGKPDLELAPAGEFSIPAEGNDVYRCFVLHTNESTDRWVSVAELRPGNRRVVHHALLYIDTTGKGRELAETRGDKSSYQSFGGIGFAPKGGLGGWAPGIVPLPLPDGIGYFLPKGADIILQIHYHPDGKPETDQTRIGIHFCRSVVDKQYHSIGLSDHALDIPAGDADYEVHKTFPPGRGTITLLSITPHMHLLGRKMSVTVKYPDGTTKTLIDVPNWDFNWQTIYRYKDPFTIPRGAIFTLNATYDNSTGNPRNPNAVPKEVTWGEQTTDEMCIAFLGFTINSEHLAKRAAEGAQ